MRKLRVAGVHLPEFMLEWREPIMRVQVAADMSAHDVFHGLATNTGEGYWAVVYRLMVISLFVCWRDVCLEPVLGQLATRE